MRKALFMRALGKHRGAILWVCLALIAYSALIVAMWGMVDMEAYAEIVEQLGDVAAFLGGTGTSIATIGGYVAIDYLGILWVIIAGALVILFASCAVAGEVADGTAEFVMSQPVSRTSFIATKIAALIVICLLVDIATFAPLFALGPIFDFLIPTKNYLLLAGIGMACLLCIGSFALMLSTFCRGAGKPAAITAGVLLVMWALSIAIGFVPELEVLEPFTFFNYWDPASIIDEGICEPYSWIVFLGSSAICLIVATLRFTRRDLV